MYVTLKDKAFMRKNIISQLKKYQKDNHAHLLRKPNGDSFYTIEDDQNCAKIGKCENRKLFM